MVSSKSSERGGIMPLNLDRIIGGLLLVSSLICILYLSIQANTDLAGARYILSLDMDELISFDGVRSLLHAPSLSSFIHGIIDGKDHRYGRLFYNILAITSYFPEKINGISGQIIATRLTVSVALLMGMLLLITTHIQSWTLRGITFMTLLVLPSTPYYLTLPKPEPFQLVFIALFLMLAKRHHYQFGYYWFFLGIAFGLKISTLFIIPIVAVMGYWLHTESFKWIPLPQLSWLNRITHTVWSWWVMLLALFNICYGILLLIQGAQANPIRLLLKNIPGLDTLIPTYCLVWGYAACPIILGICLMGIHRYLTSHGVDSRLKPVVLVKTLGVFLMGWAMAVPLIALKFPIGLMIWTKWTLLGSGHDLDDTSITLGSWPPYIIHHYLNIPSIIAILILVSSCCLLVWQYLLFKKNQSTKMPSYPSFSPLAIPIGLIGMAVLWGIIIISGIHRLSGYYLYLGLILYVIGISMLTESAIQSWTRRNLSWGMISTLITLMGSGIVAWVYLLPPTITRMVAYSKRTQSNIYNQQMAYYNGLLDSLTHLAKHKRLLVYFPPDLFMPDNPTSWTIIPYTGLFNSWEKEPDVIVMKRDFSPQHLTLPPTSAYYKALAEAKYTLHRHLSSSCKEWPCYTELSTPQSTHLILLVKQPIYDKIHPY